MSYTMKADFINPFLVSTLSVLEEMAGVEDVEPGKPVVKQAKEAHGYLSSIVDMSGRPVHGSYALTFSLPFLRAICSHLFSDELRAGGDIKFIAQDMIGEIANIACGRAKNILSQEGFEFSLSTPRTEMGPGHQVEHTLDRPVIQIPFASQWDQFFIEVSFCEVSDNKTNDSSTSENYNETIMAVA